jgi:hypothetical protein
MGRAPMSASATVANVRLGPRRECRGLSTINRWRRAVKPLAQPISNSSEHQRRTAFINRDATVMPSARQDRVAIEQQTLDLHHSIDRV